MCLSYVYTSNKSIRCFFFTVVVKNESLVKNYLGSLKGFMEKHYPLCNQDISVRVYMNGSDVYDLIDDLIENGLKMGEDFACFNAIDLVDDMYRYPPFSLTVKRAYHFSPLICSQLNRSSLRPK